MANYNEQPQKPPLNGKLQGQRSAKANVDPSVIPIANTQNRGLRASNITPPDTEDDPIPSDPPPLRNNAIRRSALTGAQPRVTTTQNVPVPPRRTANVPQQPNTTSTVSPYPPPPQRNVPKQQSVRPKERGKRQIHWLLYVGLGMIAMLLISWGFITLYSWGQARLDDLRYGNPRTFQIDAVVGHGGDSKEHPTHFIAVNLHGQIIIMEFPASNPAASVNPTSATSTTPTADGTSPSCNCYIYLGPDFVQVGGDLTPVTLEFRNVSGGTRPDMLIHTPGQVFVLINDGTKFRPVTNADHIHL